MIWSIYSCNGVAIFPEPTLAVNSNTTLEAVIPPITINPKIEAAVVTFRLRRYLQHH